jgi:lariat debranching enzyme
LVYAVCGDCHGDIQGLYKYLLELQERTGTKIDATISVGDFGLYRHNITQSDWGKYWTGELKAPIPTWVCPGNHEGWREIVDWQNQPKKVPNIHLLTDGEITDILGFKVGVVWGNYSAFSYQRPERVEEARRDYDKLLHIPNCYDWLRAMHIYRPSVERLQAQGAFDMLLTHEGTLGLTQTPRQPPKNLKAALGLSYDEPCTGCPAFLDLYKSGRPAIHFYGHYHSFRIMQEYNYRQCKPLTVGLHCFNFNKEQSVWTFER